MKIIYSKKKLINSIIGQKNLGFVPTMGAIHSGHISLIKKSINQSNKTIVSIFINKPQFNKKNDFLRYPKNLKSDILSLNKLKVDYLYIPSSFEIYPTGPSRNIKICLFSKKLCGKNRPGHFEAVVDVISRFIEIIKPQKIYFGEKDMQQLKIVEHFIKKNYSNIKVIGCRTIREKNGIPFSSRNLLLTSKEKKIASNIYKYLKNKKRDLIKKKISLITIKKDIFDLGANKIDYIKLLNINKIIKPFKKKLKYRIFIAYFLGSIRLIDNF